MALVTSGGEILVSNDAGMSWSVGSQLICAIPSIHFVELKASEERGQSYIPPPAKFFEKRLNKTTGAAIVVDYGDGFTDDAKKAFQYAADIWASLISSPVVIRVQVGFRVFTDDDDDFFGQNSGYITVHSTTFNNQPIPNTFYPFALDEKLHGSNLNYPEDGDIGISLNESIDWYFGTDGNPASNQIDFVTVVLHELCHGLGYCSGLNYNRGIGELAVYPYIFDRFLYNGSGQALLSFPPSIELGSRMTSDNVFWGEASGPNMYAPTTFSGGSSLSHLDFDTYGAYNNNTDDRLMSYVANGIATHSPGPIIIGQMNDMGWGDATIQPNIIIYPNSANFGYVAFGSSKTQDIIIKNNSSANLNISAISISGPSFSRTDGNTSYPITLAPAQTCTLTVKFSPIYNGSHTGTITLTHNTTGSPTIVNLTGTGERSISVEEPTDVANSNSTFLFQNNPNPVISDYDVSINYRLNSSGQVNLNVYDVLGREVAKLVNEYKPQGMHLANFNTRNLPSGVYFYKLKTVGYEGLKKMLIIR